MSDSSYEPSVDHGQIFTNSDLAGKNLNQPKPEINSENHSVGRGVCFLFLCLVFCVLFLVLGCCRWVM